MSVTSKFNVLEIVRCGSNLSFVMNPDFQSIVDEETHERIIFNVLDIAIDLISSGETITFTRHPSIDLIIRLSLDESGVIMIDSMGSKKYTLQDLRNYLEQALRSF